VTRLGFRRIRPLPFNVRFEISRLELTPLADQDSATARLDFAKQGVTRDAQGLARVAPPD
jgi:hypothetical protein